MGVGGLGKFFALAVPQSHLGLGNFFATMPPQSRLVGGGGLSGAEWKCFKLSLTGIRRPIFAHVIAISSLSTYLGKSCPSFLEKKHDHEVG
jgi:hypothetical protein